MLAIFAGASFLGTLKRETSAICQRYQEQEFLQILGQGQQSRRTCKENGLYCMWSFLFWLNVY